MTTIVFMGTPEFAVPSLRALLEAGHDVLAVMTRPDKPAGRGLKVKPSAVKQFAELHGLPLLQPEHLQDHVLHEKLALLEPDLFVVVAYRILPQEIIEIPNIGAINVHASLLPQYRGAAPINWAIINGERETGVTTFFIKRAVDTGNILLQQALPIGEDETAGELHDRLMMLGADLIVKTVEGLEESTLTARPQVDLPNLKTAPRIFPEDCELKPEMTLQQAHNLVRGLSPAPGAWITHNDRRIKILGTSRSHPAHHGSSFLFMHDSRLYLGLSDGALEVTEIQPPGKVKMSGAEFGRGWRQRPA
jgi:methionyl-tRNA formyltransferase